MANRTYELGGGVTCTDMGIDPCNIVGRTADVPNRLWGARLTGTTQCKVIGFIGSYKFSKSGRKRAYVIQAEDDNFFYPIAADYLEHLVQIMPRKAAQDAAKSTFGKSITCLSALQSIDLWQRRADT